MRKADREVKDFSAILDILRRSDTIRLGLHGDPYPYVVPLSFGYEAAGDKIALYFHGAKEGLKHDLIAKNHYVCAEADIFHEYAEVPGSITTVYESFIGFGQVNRVTGGEAVRGLDLLLDHCGHGGLLYDRAVLDVTFVYKIELDSFTAKRRLV